MPIQSAKVIESALTYAKRGWSVIPLHSIVSGECTCKRKCRSPGKHPIQSKWQDKGLTDPIEIERVFKKYPTANIGIITGVVSELFVLDIDPRNGGNDSLQALIDANPLIKDALQTFTVSTGGGGKHYYYNITEPVKSAKKHLFGDGVDLKGDGGYVVAAPSNHASGVQYSEFSDIDILPLPQTLIDLMQQTAVTPESNTITEGGRNNHLHELACELLRSGKSAKQVEIKLLSHNAKHCTPQLDTSEVYSILDSAVKSFNPLRTQSFKTQWQTAICEAKQGLPFIGVLTSLSLWMDSEGDGAYPSEDAIVDRIGSDRKTIRKYLHLAEELGFIKRIRRGRDGNGYSTMYVATLPTKDG